MDYFLARHKAFRSILPSSLENALPLISLLRYKRGEFIFEEGNPAQAVYLLRSGLIKAAKYSPNSDLAAMEIITPGEMFGMIAVMDKKNYPVSASSLQNSEVYRISERVFTEFLEKYPAFSKEVYSAIGRHIRHAQTLRSLSKEPAERRIAGVLALLSESMGRNMPLRRQDIAELAACTPETAMRTLANFKKNKIISSGWKRVTILDNERLNKISSF